MRLGRFVVLMLGLAIMTGVGVAAAGFGVWRAILSTVGVLVACQVGYFAYLVIKAARLPQTKDEPPPDP